MYICSTYRSLSEFNKICHNNDDNTNPYDTKTESDKIFALIMKHNRNTHK